MVKVSYVIDDEKLITSTLHSVQESNVNNPVSPVVYSHLVASFGGLTLFGGRLVQLDVVLVLLTF